VSRLQPEPQRLYAQMEMRNVPGTEELLDVVCVRFGEIEVATMPPCRASNAGHGDDSTYFVSEEQDIVAETVAPVLAQMFTVAMQGQS
jgi:hypothetical protein